MTLRTFATVERNPYSPPGAAVLDIEGSRLKGRPFAVWVVLAIYAIDALAMGVELIASFWTPLSLPAAELRFYRITGLPRDTSAFLSGVLSILVAINLYRLKRGAAYFVTASFAVSVFSACCFIAGLDPSEHGVLASFVVGSAIEVLAVGYVWNLWRKRVLI
jgi:hypothetical protein